GFAAALAVLITGASQSRQQGEVFFTCSWLGYVELLLVALDTKLKIFHSLSDYNTSCERTKCSGEVQNYINLEVEESVLNDEKKHVLDVI
ncbi:hypothetical protein Tco_0109146, partial [Tanacetum coccineum]